MGKRNKGYSKSKQAEVEARVKGLMDEDYSDLEIGKILCLQPHVVRYYKKRIHEKAKHYFESLTPEMVLVGFATTTQENIEHLEWVKKESRRTGSRSLAYVQAVKLQCRMENDVIKLAQTLGLLPKRARQLQVANMHFQKHAMTDIRRVVEHDVENIPHEKCG